jgi:hypothetical protein
MLLVGAAAGIVATVAVDTALDEHRAPAQRRGPQSELLRHGEIALHSVERSSGSLRLEPIGLTFPLLDLIGTHADVEPHGAFVRVRVRVRNVSGTFHDFAATDQRLQLRGGRQLAPSTETMTIARQPDVLSVPAHALVEFDLWFDVPAGAHLSGIVLTTSRDGSAAGPGTSDVSVRPVRFALPSPTRA